ncbi:unnamed protein product [Spirodela intermedia]|uniref:NAC domain-containing protein n=1 Tax=Spirodela intermedia TaxID=51605 RepID=A0A7I8KTJ5_SPIIN|nr:unnamed protein product [Spirodela intermedia]
MAAPPGGVVPPGFRFHPTDEELLHFYLRKKVGMEKFELDVIREVDVNKIEPWELQERCTIGSGPQREWYFFSHRGRKYPTGSRMNRATGSGFWKATGRDKCIRRSAAEKLGMRKTLVFYSGRAPCAQKTDWIMHEYRLHGVSFFMKDCFKVDRDESPRHREGPVDQPPQCIQFQLQGLLSGDHGHGAMQRSDGGGVDLISGEWLRFDPEVTSRSGDHGSAGEWRYRRVAPPPQTSLLGHHQEEVEIDVIAQRLVCE